MLSKLRFFVVMSMERLHSYTFCIFFSYLFINDEGQDRIVPHTIRYSNPYLNDIFLVVRLTLAEGGIGGGGGNEVLYRS